MKKLLCFLLLFIIPLFSSCVKSTSIAECINDFPLQEPLSPSYYISLQIPEDVFLTASCEDGCCAEFSHRDYVIVQEIFRAESREDALMHLSGRDSSTMQVIQTGSFPREECRFSWTAAGEGGTLSCLGMMILDGAHCYSTCIFCPVGMEKSHAADFSQVFSTMELLPI